METRRVHLVRVGGGGVTGRRGAQGAAQESAPDGIQGDEVQTEFLFEWDEWRS